MIISRRNFLIGITAPAIVRATSLMPINSLLAETSVSVDIETRLAGIDYGHMETQVIAYVIEQGGKMIVEHIDMGVSDAKMREMLEPYTRIVDPFDFGRGLKPHGAVTGRFPRSWDERPSDVPRRISQVVTPKKST